MTDFTFTYRITDIDFPREDKARCTLELTLAGDTYQITAEHEDDEGWTEMDVTLDGVDQYWEYEESKDFGYGGPGSTTIRGGWVNKDTYISRTIPMGRLEEWILDEIFAPVQAAIGEAIQAARQAGVQQVKGTSGSVTWEND